MPAESPLSRLGGKPGDLACMYVAGGAAGVLACPAGTIGVGDEVICVSRFTTATFAPGTDITSEFLTAMGGTGKCTVALQISNLGGSSTAGQLLCVLYAKKPSRG